MLSVICPVYNEEKYIHQCLDSILAQDFPKDELEVLMVDGMSTDSTRAVVLDYAQKYPFIHLVDNPKRIVPCAMNEGIRASHGDVIMRLDAHSHYEPNYFSALTQKLAELDADNVGCVCRTDVLNRTPKSLAIREVLCNKLGVGNSTFRTGITHAQEVDTVPFGCWPRSAFHSFGVYDERLVRNQDYELNRRIRHGGGKIWIVPDTHCTYLARETYGALARNNYANGKWNVLTLFYTRQMRALSLRHFIPLIFVLSLLLPAIAGIFWHPLWLIGAASLISYTTLMSFESLQLSHTKHLNFFHLLLSFMVLHLSYGWGSLMGLLSLPFRKNEK